MSTTVTTHLRNQIQAAVDHAGANHEGPLARSNTITDAVVSTIEAHATCSHCHAAAPVVVEELAEHRAIWDHDVSYEGPVGCSCGYETDGVNEERLADYEHHIAQTLARA